jgi:hypothetical protein
VSIACVLGECTEGKFGLHNLFSKMNGGEPLPFTLDFEDKELHCCFPVEVVAGSNIHPLYGALPLVHYFILLSI